MQHLVHVRREFLHRFEVGKRFVFAYLADWKVANDVYAQLVNRKVLVLGFRRPPLSRKPVALVVYDQVRQKRRVVCASGTAASA